MMSKCDVAGVRYLEVEWRGAVSCLGPGKFLSQAKNFHDQRECQITREGEGYCRQRRWEES